MKEQVSRLLPASFDTAKVLACPWTYEEDPRGTLGFVADRGRGFSLIVLQARKWIYQASQAIWAKIRIEKLLDSVEQFPTHSETSPEALETLDL